MNLTGHWFVIRVEMRVHCGVHLEISPEEGYREKVNTYYSLHSSYFRAHSMDYDPLCTE